MITTWQGNHIAIAKNSFKRCKSTHLLPISTPFSAWHPNAFGEPSRFYMSSRWGLFISSLVITRMPFPLFYSFWPVLSFNEKDSVRRSSCLLDFLLLVVNILAAVSSNVEAFWAACTFFFYQYLNLFRQLFDVRFHILDGLCAFILRFEVYF